MGAAKESAKTSADGGSVEEKPHTGVGRYGTAPPLTSHGGRSRVVDRSGGKNAPQDAVTKGCHAVLARFASRGCGRGS